MTSLSSFRMDGRTCLVTGGSRGIGFAIAQALGGAGARIAITARKADELEQARAALVAQGIETRAFQNDLADEDKAPDLVAAVTSALGPIDVLFNNAGATWGQAAADVERRRWHHVIDVNLNGTWALTQAVARSSMLPRKSGSIVMVASVGGVAAQPPGTTPTASYHASKAAQINLARALASEWGPHGIRVNALAPGWFDTRMTRATLDQLSAAQLDRLPLGRVGDVDLDIGGPALFLASDASRYVTGHTLVVDGGMTAIL